MWDKNTTKYVLQGAPCSLKKANTKQIPPLKKPLKNQNNNQPKIQQEKPNPSNSKQPAQRYSLFNVVIWRTQCSLLWLCLGMTPSLWGLVWGLSWSARGQGCTQGPGCAEWTADRNPRTNSGGCTWKGRTPCSLLDPI